MNSTKNLLIYKATEALNFAQGELMMLGAFCGLAASSYFGLPYWMVLLVALSVLAGFGYLTERLVLRPILGQPAFAIVMVTIGIGYTARGLITMIPGIGTDTPYTRRAVQGSSAANGRADHRHGTRCYHRSLAMPSTEGATKKSPAMPDFF